FFLSLISRAPLSSLFPYTTLFRSMAFVFAENATGLYSLTDVLDIGVSSEFLYAIVAVAVVSLLNIVGVNTGKWTQNLLTVAKIRSEEHTSELQSLRHLVCRLLLEK